MPNKVPKKYEIPKKIRTNFKTGLTNLYNAEANRYINIQSKKGKGVQNFVIRFAAPHPPAISEFKFSSDELEDMRI